MNALINGAKATVKPPYAFSEAHVRAEFCVERKIAPIVRPLPGKRPIHGIRLKEKDSNG